MEAAGCQRIYQEPDCISCMPVQQKNNHRIVIIVSVARAKNLKARLFIWIPLEFLAGEPRYTLMVQVRVPRASQVVTRMQKSPIS